MGFDLATRTKIFDRTAGRCHICHQPVTFEMYGRLDAPDGWEVEHSNPKVLGGTDQLKNLYAAHWRCNRSKQARSTRTARAQHGYTAAPWSEQKRAAERDKNSLRAFLGGGTGALLAGVAGPVAWAIAVGAAVIARLIDPER